MRSASKEKSKKNIPVGVVCFLLGVVEDQCCEDSRHQHTGSQL